MLRSEPPSHLSRISGVRISRKSAPISLASARDSMVLPVPGGPYIRMPCGRRAPQRAIASGCRNDTAICRSSADDVGQAADLVEGDRLGGGRRPAGTVVAAHHVPPARAALSGPGRARPPPAGSARRSPAGGPGSTSSRGTSARSRTTVAGLVVGHRRPAARRPRRRGCRARGPAAGSAGRSRPSFLYAAAAAAPTPSTIRVATGSPAAIRLASSSPDRVVARAPAAGSAPWSAARRRC